MERLPCHVSPAHSVDTVGCVTVAGHEKARMWEPAGGPKESWRLLWPNAGGSGRERGCGANGAYRLLWLWLYSPVNGEPLQDLRWAPFLCIHWKLTCGRESEATRGVLQVTCVQSDRFPGNARTVTQVLGLNTALRFMVASNQTQANVKVKIPRQA